MSKDKKININSEVKKIGLEFGIETYPELSADNVKKVHNYVVNISSYAGKNTGNHVEKYFKEHAGDVDLAVVVTKVTLVDSTDSTNLLRLLGRNGYERMAKRIIESKVEDLIKNGEPIDDRMIEYLSKWTRTKNGKEESLNLFIFISKYITRTSTYSYGGNCYSIMDNVVKKNLSLYNDKNKGIVIPSLEALRKTYRYKTYCEIMGEIANKLGVTREMLDHFIWFVFKEEASADRV